MNPVSSYAGVALGSALGGLGRYGSGALAQALWGAAFPWGTILINIIGSFIIGGFATLTLPEGRRYVGPLGRLFVMAGFCGGYTTFSAFSLDTLELLQQARPVAAAANAGLSVLLCLIAVWLGHALARRLNRA